MTESSTHNEESAGARLRQLVLSTPARELGFVADDAIPKVYGVLTEWDVEGVAVTVMCMRDGAASLYTTSTFGIIGGHGHERVRQAAVRCVKLANRFADAGTAATEFPYPKKHEVFFYLLTHDGIPRVRGNLTAMTKGSDPTHPLFAAAQDVLTELRVVAERMDARRQPPEVS